MQAIDLSDFLKLRSRVPVLDVRSPGEYQQGHIVGSVNMPLFSNEERAEVGTLYKQESPKIAFRRGLEIIGPKMPGFIDFADSLQSDQLLVHCWRGGQRSGSVAMLLNAYGIQAITLKGGYKSYRKAIVDYFESPLNLIVLTGYTGSLKTHVLHELAKLGEQVVDLEGLAHHQGSAFGRSISEIQPTTEQFQNDLFESFKVLNNQKRIWLEDESLRIGGVNMLQSLYLQKNASPYVFLDIPSDVRIQNLIENYSQQPREKLIRATESIRKKLGVKEATEAVESINSGDAKRAASIILKYYDKRYYKSIADKKSQFKLQLKTETRNPKEIAQEILKRL